MIASYERLIDYFVVCGLNENRQVSSDTHTPHELSTDSIFYIGNNVISSIRLLITDDNEIINPTGSRFFEFLEIAVKDKKRLWLEIAYGVCGGNRYSHWNGRAICSIELFDIKSYWSKVFGSRS